MARWRGGPVKHYSMGQFFLWSFGAVVLYFGPMVALGSEVLNGEDEQVVLTIIGFHPMSGDWADGPALRYVAEEATLHINNHPDFLPGYKLNFTWIDSKCNAGYGVYKLTEELYRPPTKVIIIGGGCAIVCRAASEFSHYYQLSHISPEATAAYLSDKDLYPRFFRNWPPESARNPMLIELFHYYKWYKVATIFEFYETFQWVTEHLVGMMEENNITLLTSELIQEDPTKQVRNLKVMDARIIVGNFWEAMARKVFCEAYKVGLYGPHIVWILIGWMQPDWWEKPDPAIDCSREQMKRAAEGALYGNAVLENPDLDEVTISGLTPRQIDTMLLDKRPDAWDMFAYEQRFYTWDMMLFTALALNKTLTDLSMAPPNSSLHGKQLSDFSYRDGTMGLMIKNNMHSLKFTGSLGLTQFNENQDPKSIFDIWYQMDGVRVKQGYFYPDLNGLPVIKWLKKEAIPWRGGRIPSDSTQILIKKVFLRMSVYLPLVSLAGLGILLSIVFLIFNIIFRGKRVIRMSSPRMNNVILCGCVALFATVFFHEQDEQHTQAFCTVRNFTTTIGFSLVFGALFSKTWRVHVIFSAKSAKSVAISDVRLFGVVLVIVLVNLIVLVLWTTLDPYYVEVLRMPGERISGEEDVVIEYQLAVCRSNYTVYFSGVLYIIQGLLLAFGAFLAWETRKVKIEALNDSQLIGTCIYNVMILSALGVGLGLVLSHEIHLVASLNAVFILLATFCTQLIVFLPKVTSVLKGQADVKPANVNTVTGTLETAPSTT